MTEAAGRLAGAVGWLLGWLTRRSTVTSVLELLGGTSVVVGLAGWSVNLALVVLGLMLLFVSWRWNDTEER